MKEAVKLLHLRRLIFDIKIPLLPSILSIAYILIISSNSLAQNLNGTNIGNNFPPLGFATQDNVIVRPRLVYIDNNGFTNNNNGSITLNFASADTVSSTYLKVNQTTPQTTIGTFTFPIIRAINGSDTMLDTSVSGTFKANNALGLKNVQIGYMAGNAITTGNANIFIGKNTGLNNDVGIYNHFLGDESGKYNTSGGSNNFIGNSCGYHNTIGSNNNYIGSLSGFNADTGIENVFVGSETGYQNASGSSNVFLGKQAGRGHTGGDDNIFIGRQSGYSANNAISNVFIGQTTGYLNSTGGVNVFIGNSSGYNNDSGSYNTFIGSQAGYSNISGSSNVFIGNQAGKYETASNSFYVNNADTGSLANDKTNSLIYGIFNPTPASQSITFNVGTASFGAGNVSTTGTGTFGDVIIPAMGLGTPTYKSVSDYFNTIQSSGRLTGMTITAHSPANGTVDVSSGTGIIKATNTNPATTKFFNFAGVNSIALTDGVLNYLYIDYNSGTPQVLVTTDRTTVHDYDQFIIGRVFRQGTDATEIATTGVNVYNEYRRIHDRLLIKYGFNNAQGSATSETDTRKIAVTAGTWYIGNTQIPTVAHDSNAGYTFSTYYYNGSAWIKTTGVSQMGNTQYNNIASGLVTMTNNKYANYWVYLDPLGDFYVLYGQAEYNTLADAQVTQSPATLPNYLSQNAALISRITFQKSATNFAAVSNALITPITQGVATNHNNLAGLQGGTVGEYYHLTSAEYTPTATTGSGNMARLTSPQFTTPNIGAATATSIAIGANTLDTTEWVNLDGINQALKTSDSPTFNIASLTGLKIGTGTKTDLAHIFGASANGLTINGTNPTITLVNAADSTTIAINSLGGHQASWTLDGGFVLGFFPSTVVFPANVQANVSPSLKFYNGYAGNVRIDFVVGGGQPARCGIGMAGGIVIGNDPVTLPTIGLDVYNVDSAFTTAGICTSNNLFYASRLAAGTAKTILGIDASNNLVLGNATGLTATKIANLTTNGMLNTSSGDGTLSVLAPVRGDIAIGNSTPAWSKLAKGSAGQWITYDANDVIKSTATLPTTATGTGKILIADGTNWVASTPTFPNAATTTGAYLRADGTNFIQSTLILPNAGTAYKLAAYTATNTLTELAAVGATGELLVGNTGAIPSWSNSPSITALTLSGDLTVNGNDINFGNGSTISNATNTQLSITGDGDVFIYGASGKAYFNIASTTNATNSAVYYGATEDTYFSIGTSAGSTFNVRGGTVGNTDVIFKVDGNSRVWYTPVNFSFGKAANTVNSFYLLFAHNGLATSSTQGWVMPRAGYISAISYCLTTGTHTGNIDVQALINNAAQITTRVAAGTGLKTGYAVNNSKTTYTFSAGDVMQGYVLMGTATDAVSAIGVIVEVCYTG